MKKLRSLIIALSLMAGLGMPLLATAPARAVDVISPVCDKVRTERPGVCDDAVSGAKTNPIIGEGGVLRVGIALLSFLAGLSAIVIIIVSGIKIIFSNGDGNTMATARKQLIYAVVGLAVVLISSTIVTLVLNRIATSN